jgi:cyanophycinase
MDQSPCSQWTARLLHNDIFNLEKDRKTMNGLIALVGSGEYLPVMDEVDRYLLAHCRAQGHPARVICLPTAAGQEGQPSWGRWMQMGQQHFRRLGAEVSALPIIDRRSADDPQYTAILETADLVYFSGGNPLYLFETLNGSRAWAALQEAWAGGAVYAGCSAGAMILGRQIPSFRAAALKAVPAFGLLPVRMIFPHFDRWKVARAAMLTPLRRRLKADELVLGVDEETALVGRLDTPGWTVLGRQTVSVITKAGVRVYRSGEELVL